MRAPRPTSACVRALVLAAALALPAVAAPLAAAAQPTATQAQATTPGTTAPPPASTTTAPAPAVPGTSPAAPQGSTTPAPTPAPNAAPGASDARIQQAADDGGSGGAPPAIVALALAAGVLLFALALWAGLRWSGWAPGWAPRARHATAEAGWRASLAWADFRDWVRLGR